MTVNDLLIARSDISTIVAISDGRAIALDELRRDVGANAAALRARGCRRGLLVTRDVYWAAVGILALFEAGAVVVMPPNALSGTLASLTGEWDQLVSDGPLGASEHSYVLRRGEAVPALRELSGDTSVFELFTSGSSGDPKRVIKTLGQMEREAAAAETLLGPYVSERGIVTGTVSHQHLYGLSFRLFWPLCSGRLIDATVHEFWESLAGAALAGGAIITSPAHLTRIPGHGAVAADSRPGLILSAGAPLPSAAAAEARSIFAARVLEIYGSTETGMIAWRSRDDDDTPWRTAPGVTVRQAHDNRILVASPFLDTEAWHEGADRIRLLGDGHFELLERADRIAKIEGKRISLPEVERRILDLPEVTAVSVAVLPGDKPCLAAAIVLTEEGERALAKSGAFRFGRSLRRGLAAFIEPAGVPRRWRYVPALPAGPLGKVRTEDIVALFRDEDAGPRSGRPQEPDLQQVRHGDGWVELELFNRPDLLQLDGHFPGMAIVPGVAQVDWAVKMGARFLNLPLAAATSFQVKFHRLTLPRTVVTLRLEHDRARNRLQFAYRKPDQQLLTSGSIRLAAQ
jgi:acyl-CoA synthetase (AMP-forming)/AMP-acid ligase II/3-hydroxymyristoyl/3-hydroxydecanoyl-(acyl carrier protein) dehydratase